MIHALIDDRLLVRFRSLLNGAKRIVLTAHLGPDGDALGSTLGLCRVLRRLGKDARVVFPDMPPRALTFLPTIHEAVVYTRSEDRARELMSQAQLILCLDFNTLRRIDKLAELVTASTAPRVLIDHHLDPTTQEFDLLISYPEASSTCELVFRVLLQLQLTKLIDRLAAQCLYTGMMTDTGNFTFSCEDPELYEIQSILMRRHIDKQYLYNLAMNTHSVDSLRLRGYALSERMELCLERGASLITLPLDVLERFNYQRGDVEGLVNEPLTIPEVYWSVLMREEAGRVKVSCRSQGDFDVSVMCQEHFNGGGHKNAAGGELYMSMAEAVELYRSVLESIPIVDAAQAEPNNNENEQ